MINFLLLIYFTTIFLCLATYAFYPIVILLAGKLIPFKPQKKDITPKVSIIIAAYNEEKHIQKKIKNTLALDYPLDKLEILIGSDGSTDGTADRIREVTAQAVNLLDCNTNRGKTAVQNDLVNMSHGEILIFTDAASFLPADAIKKIVRNFADNRVGCVAGKMRFVGTDSNLTTQSQGLYWRYEVKLREMESKLGSLIGLDGPLYALRRNYYVHLEHNIISDLLTPLLVLEQGKKVILEPEAIVKEEPTSKAEQEFTTRRRITLRGLVGLFTYKQLLNPLMHPILACKIFFHKILRWCVGPLVIVHIAACLALSEHWFFKLSLAFYIIFFLAAAIGWAGDKVGFKVKILTVPYYFTLVNLAATMAIVDFIRKKQAVSWIPVRK
jgi:cellulose synthase/poly-beta-1,6-N-acetylglucosamine synthase-like glycosyltransferase